MGKVYTLDHSYFDTPEIRIGDKIYKVDDSTATVKKLAKISASEITEQNDQSDQILRLAFGGEAFDEINPSALPFPAYLQLIKLATAAMTGEEPDAVDARFQEAVAKPQ